MPGPSFDDYARARWPALVRYAYLLSGDHGVAEDLAQEALVNAHLNWKRIGQMDHPDAYIRKTVMTRFLSWRRKRSNGERPHGLLADRPPPAAPDAADATADRDVIWELLRRLPKQQRAVLVLRYYEDLTDDRIAYLLGCRPSTVRVHAARAIATLRPHAPALFPSHGNRPAR